MSNVRDFGAAGDGRQDDTAAIQHAVHEGDGVVELPRGKYLIRQPIEAPLTERGPLALHGSGGTATLIMAGPGPAIRLVGAHAGTADPGSFGPQAWDRERMPTIAGLEIEGRHAEADGIHIEGAMQPTLSGVLIRQVHTAVHVAKRARNLLITHCHLYNNTGVGVHLDHVNLHQAIITGSHISYCRLGGVRIDNSEVRNLQITGNDISTTTTSARCSRRGWSADGRDPRRCAPSGSVREGTISSNTLQATYSPNGANIRFLGGQAAADSLDGSAKSPQDNRRAGMWTITGNLIGSQWNNIHLTQVRGVTISGNYIYSGHHRNLLIEGSRNVVVGPNTFGHNPDYRKGELATGIRVENSEGVSLSGLLIEDAAAGTHTLQDAVPLQRQGLIEVLGSRRVSLTGVQILDGLLAGLYLENSREVLVNGCLISDDRRPPGMEAAIRWRGPAPGSLITGCRMTPVGADLGDKSIAQSGNLVGPFPVE